MDLEKYTIRLGSTVREAIETIERIGKKVALITDEKFTLLGIFSDGDMRRYILSGGDLSRGIETAMNPTPKVFHSREEAVRCSKTEKMVVYPIIDKDYRLTDAVFWNDAGMEHPLRQSLKGVPVVVMAGGKGTRLYPYTKVLPKPLIPIGEYTISEHIINSFMKFGARDFHFILNHMKNMIKAYFNDLEKDFAINYIDEETFLGTGGGLGLLRGKVDSTFVLSNCDVLIETDYADCFRFHKSKGNVITFICALKNIQIPYGVVDMTPEGDIMKITEKPSYSYLTNTGVYIIEPKVIEELKLGEYIDLPTIAQRYIDRGEKVGVYPVSEKAWMDMGQFKEMEEMIKVMTS